MLPHLNKKQNVFNIFFFYKFNIGRRRRVMRKWGGDGGVMCTQVS